MIASMEKEYEEERRQLSEKVAFAESRALELDAELKRQRLAQDDTRALADHRFRETEERCKHLQSLMDDVTCSASAEMDAAAERVREFQADLESWQLWAEEEKERRNELESKVTSKDFEVQHLLQQLHLANSDIEALQHSVAELKNEDQLRSQQYERKLLQYKSRVEAELQEASGRESELEIKLKAKNQECDRLGQESLKTKDLQEKVLALQAKLEESQRQRSTAAVADLEAAERRAAELERRIASTQEEHEHQLTLQRTTKARLEAATAKAQDFELQCQTLTLKLEKLQARSEENDLKFDRQLALHREEVCSAFSRVQELERQISRRKVEEERLEQDLGTKTREVEDLQVELLKAQEQERKCSELAMECEDLKGQILTSKQELEKEKTLSSDLEKKREELQAKLEASKQTFEEQLQSSKQEFDSEREHLEAQLQASKQASEELEQESTRFSELDTRCEQLEAQLQASKQAMEDLEKETGRCLELEAQLQNSEQELVEERTRSIELDRRCGELEAQLLSSKQAFEEQTDAMEEARAHVEGLSKSLKESREKCDALWLRKEDLELKLSGVQNSAAEQITFFQEQLRASKDAAQARDESFREKLADLSEAKRQVAELQQMIKERDAEIENYEEILKQPTMDLQAPSNPVEGLQLEPVRPKVTLHLDVAKTTLSPTSNSPGSPCAPGGLMRSKGLHPGVSVQHICGSFVEDVEAAGSSPASPIYELEKLVAKWTAAAVCPVDGQLGAAYVYGLEGDTRCAATHLLSYSSVTALQDVAHSLKQHCNEVGTSTDKAFIWLKTLCWNLHRNEITDPMEMKSLTDERIRSIGHVLVLLTPWDEPDYFQRKWCTMEMELALSLSQLSALTTVTLLTTLQELDRLGEAICTSSSVVPQVWQRCAALCLDHSITAHFRAWIATSAETWLRQRLAQGQHDGGVAVAVLAVACDTVGWLLREVSLHHRAAALLQDALQLALCGSDMEGSSSPVLCCLGTTMGCCCNQTELLQSCDSAIQAHQQKGTLETMAGMELLSSFGAAMWMSGDPEGAARALQQAVFIRVANRTLDNPQGAMLLRNFGVMKWAMGFHKESLELFEEAKRVRKCTGCFCGAHAAVLMMNMGYAKAELGDFQGSLEAFQEVLALLTVGSASSSMTFGDSSFALPDPLDTMPCGATLISSIAVAKGNLGRYDDALRAYSRAQLIRKSTKTMCSPAGAVLLRNKGMAHFGRKEYAEALSAYLAAKDIRQETGTLKTSGGANLLSNLASARAKTGDGIVAVEDCQRACHLHKQVGTLQTPGGQAALKQLKELKRCCPKATKEEVPQRRKASKDKTLKTPNRDKAK